MSRRLALFPLDVVLFPGASLQLHIFEPRYQDLLRDVLLDDARFGLLTPGVEGTPPSSGTLGCVARVVADHPLGDDRSNILVTGDTRFALREIVPTERAYLVGLVDEFGDTATAEKLPPDTLEHLTQLAERCREALGNLTDQKSGERWADDPAVFTFQVAAALPWTPEQARQLLTLRSAAQRADLLLRILPQIVPDLESRALVRKRAGRNGKGRHDPDIGNEG